MGILNNREQESVRYLATDVARASAAIEVGVPALLAKHQEALDLLNQIENLHYGFGAAMGAGSPELERAFHSAVGALLKESRKP